MAMTVGMSVLAIGIGAMQQLELTATLARVPRLPWTEETSVEDATALATGQTLQFIGGSRRVVVKVPEGDTDKVSTSGGQRVPGVDRDGKVEGTSSVIVISSVVEVLLLFYFWGW